MGMVCLHGSKGPTHRYWVLTGMKWIFGKNRIKTGWSKPEPDDETRDRDHGLIISGGFVVSRGQAAKVLPFGEQILHCVARLVEEGVMVDGGLP